MVRLAGTLLLVAELAGCGGGGGGGTTPPPAISVSLAPAGTTTIDQGQTVNFTATVTNDSSNKGVTWSVSGTGCSGAACGSFTNTTATTATYNAPTPVSSDLTVSVKATSVADTSKSASSTVVVKPPPSITITSLSDGVGGTGYSATLQVSGGAGTLTWTVISGTLPPGLSLDSSTGVISGTPTSTGSWTFTVQVTDSGSPALSAQQQLSITVNPGTLTITTMSLPSGLVGTPYSAPLTYSGGTPPITWGVTVGTLPDGLSLNASTGAISGTPTTAETADFTLTATDSATPTPQTVNKQLSITITAATLSITTTSLPEGVVSTAYNTTLQASGGTPPVTWSVTVGTLAAGLSLNSSTGVISGTPTSTGSWTFTVQVTDSGSPALSAQQQLSITVNPGTFTITTTWLADTTGGKPYNYTLGSTGGIPPITWAVISGALPGGLSLDASTGRISGRIDPVSGLTTASFTVQATDSATTPAIATQLLSILVHVGNDVCTPESTAGTTPISNGTIRASISPYGDIDVYSFQGTAGAQVTIEIFAQRLDLDGNPSTQDSYLDSILELLDSNCNVIALNDDVYLGTITDSKIRVGSTPFPSPPCPPSGWSGCADVTPPTSLPYTGTYFIRVRDFRGDGRPDLIYELSLSGAD